MVRGKIPIEGDDVFISSRFKELGDNEFLLYIDIWLQD
jgi:hypothetical protein